MCRHILALLFIVLLTQSLRADVGLQQDPNLDFDNNGVVDFPDFLLFVAKFGARQGDEKYEDRFDLDGDGEIGFGDFVNFVANFGKAVAPDGGLSMSYIHVKEGRGIWKLDPQSLQVIGTYPPPPSAIPRELARVTSQYPGMGINTRWARGAGTRPGERYLLRWETLGRNRDLPREEIPPPSDLRLYILER